MLSNNDINDIYNNYVKINYTIEYTNKYVPLPLQYNNKQWKWEGKDFPRIIALLEFREYMLEYNKTFNDVLSFNGDSDPEYEYMKYNNLHNFNYEENEKYDLHKIDLDKKDFDFAMTNQTIEHLYNPILAIKNIYNHLKIGGIFYTNVPADNVPHSTPFHFYTGITPVGLGAMVKLAGFDILKIGQWGNKEYFRQMHDKLWSDYTYSTRAGYNDVKCPIITWCLAIKNK
jgi:SAM-dependent methyltransferase